MKRRWPVIGPRVDNWNLWISMLARFIRKSVFLCNGILRWVLLFSVWISRSTIILREKVLHCDQGKNRKTIVLLWLSYWICLIKKKWKEIVKHEDEYIKISILQIFHIYSRNKREIIVSCRCKFLIFWL